MPVLLAAGCSQSTFGGVACPAGPGGIPAQAVMLYPIPGATGVPDDVGIVIYASAASAGTITLAKGAAGSSISAVPTPLSSPLPSPLAFPTGGDTPTYAAAFPTLDAASTYTVSFKSSQTGPCAAPKQNIGSFSTQ